MPGPAALDEEVVELLSDELLVFGVGARFGVPLLLTELCGSLGYAADEVGAVEVCDADPHPAMRRTGKAAVTAQDSGCLCCRFLRRYLTPSLWMAPRLGSTERFLRAQVQWGRAGTTDRQ